MIIALSIAMKHNGPDGIHMNGMADIIDRYYYAVGNELYLKAEEIKPPAQKCPTELVL